MSRLSEILGQFLTVLVLLSCLPSAANFAQDARELEAEKVKSNKLKGEHPLVELMRSRKSALRPELRGVHPRVYVTDKELDSLRERARINDQFVIDAGSAKMSVFVVAPKRSQTKIEASDLTTPGPPGSVDKGERVVRGQRVAISTGPSTSVQLTVKLKPTPQRIRR